MQLSSRQVKQRTGIEYIKYMKLLIIAGPNGAGKTTIAQSVLKEIGVEEFVNADHIAQGLSMLHPEKIGFAAGRIAFRRID